MASAPTHIRHERMSKGAKAFRTGKGEASCPFAKGGEAWHDWMHGYRSAKEGNELKMEAVRRCLG